MTDWRRSLYCGELRAAHVGNVVTPRSIPAPSLRF